MPLAPAGGFNVGAHFGVQEYGSGIRPPGTAQPYVLDRGLGRQLAVIEHEAAVLSGRALSMRGNVAELVRSAVDFAVFENRLAISEDEIHVALDVAVRKKLPALGRVYGILVAQEPHVAEDRAVGGDVDREGLRALRQLRMGGVEVVGEGQVLRGEAGGLDLHRGGFRGAAGYARALA